MIVEGVSALPADIKLAEKYDVKMPITKTLNDIITGTAAAWDSVGILMD